MSETGDRAGRRVTFADCVMTAAATPELVEQFDRLTGHHLSKLDHRSGLDAMIDEATGRDRAAILDFLDFVWDCVYTRLPPEAVAGE